MRRLLSIFFLLPTVAALRAADDLPSSSHPAPDLRPSLGQWLEVPPAAPPAVAESSEADARIHMTPGLQLMLEGLQNLSEGELDLGIRKLEQVIEMEPTLLGAWESLGWAYWQQGRPEKTRALWERLRRLTPSSPVPLNLLGRAAMAQGHWEEAEGLFRQSLERDPWAFETRLAYAMVLLRLDRSPAALPILRELVAERPEREDARRELAQTLSALSLYDEAVVHWRILTEQVPENASYARAYALALLYTGNLDTARAVARGAVERDPANIEGLLILADIAEAAAEPTEAADQIRAIVARTDSPLPRARLRMRLCERLYRLYQTDPERVVLETVLDEGRRALRDDPRLIPMRLFLAEILLRARRFPEAEREFQNVLWENARNLRALRGLFESAIAQAKWEEAEAIRQRMDESLVPVATRLLDEARLAFGRGAYEEAIQVLERLECEAARGTVFLLGYRRLGASDWEPGLSVRRFRDQLTALRRAGFVFITPDQLARHFRASDTVEGRDRLPAPARFFRWLRRELREPDPSAAAERSSEATSPPFPKTALVFFQGAYRDTLRQAAAVAEDLDIPMTIHVATGDRDRRAMGAASWTELRPLLASSRWKVGSFGLDADLPAPGFPDAYEVPPLPNRLWLAEPKRLETLREWNSRIRREMRESRARIEERLGLPPNTPLSLVYPFGDIGQAGLCNIGSLENVPRLILDEAGALFSWGFLPDARGFALAGDTPMALPFYEPGVRAEGVDVLRHAFEHHPLMAARRMRAEIAALQGNARLAQEQIARLEEDGWPPELLFPLREFVRQRLYGFSTLPPASMPDEDRSLWFSPSDLFISLEGRIEEANRDYREQQAGARVGIRLNPRNALEGWAFAGRFDQESRSNRWFTIRETTVTETRTETITIENGRPRRRERLVRREITREVETNETVRLDFQSDLLEGGAAILHRFRDGSTLRLHAGASQRLGAAGSKTLLEFGVQHRWKPWESLEVTTAFDQGAVPSARVNLRRSTLSLTTFWQPADRWELSAVGAYTEVSDTNALLHLSARALWAFGATRTLQTGLGAALVTADDPRETYWTPYWYERVDLISRFQKVYRRFRAESELRLGLSREKGRPDDWAAWRNRQVRGEREGWDPGDEPGTGWEPVVGLGLSFDRRFGRTWSLGVSGACSFYSDYSEYRLDGALRRHFGESSP